MLVLTRRPGEAIRIGDGLCVRVVRVSEFEVELRIEPIEIPDSSEESEKPSTDLA